MGQGYSTNVFKPQNPVNYNCPQCKTSGKVPNMAGKFFIINDTECQCNGCNTIFQKKQFYVKPTDANTEFIDGC
jgi:hypothetical protein